MIAGQNIAYCDLARVRYRLRPLLPFLRGTLAPFFRASLSPIAMACFWLVTLRPEPLFSVPFFLRCIADFTRLRDALPYFAMRRSSCKICAGLQAMLARSEFHAVQESGTTP